MFKKLFSDWLGYAIVFGGTALGLLTSISIYTNGAITYIEPNHNVITLELISFAYGMIWLMMRAKRFGWRQ